MERLGEGESTTFWPCLKLSVAAILRYRNKDEIWLAVQITDISQIAEQNLLVLHHTVLLAC